MNTDKLKTEVTYLKIEGSKVWATGMVKPNEFNYDICDESEVNAFNKALQAFEGSFLEVGNPEVGVDLIIPPIINVLTMEYDEGIYPAPEGLEMEVRRQFKHIDKWLDCHTDEVAQRLEFTSSGVWKGCALTDYREVCTLSFSSPKEEPQEESTKQEKPDWDKDSLSQTIKLSELQERNDKLEDNLKMAVDRRTEFEALQSYNAQLVELLGDCLASHEQYGYLYEHLIQRIKEQLKNK